MGNFFSQLTGRLGRPRRPIRSTLPGQLESLEIRSLLSADPLPVLMVIANQDFYYQEYGDTRASLEAAGLSVQVAATTTNPSTPHAGSGQGSSSGVVTPDLALRSVDASNYSAIVFVGGWGSSMYQYSFPGDYADDLYDGDLATKAVVNSLINDFVEQDKYVSAICHGVTVLAWARVDGVSPLEGRTVAVPWIGSPAVNYENTWYGYFELSQYSQVAANGATANLVSGQYGIPGTAHDDVVVDGRIITAENYDSAAYFGTVVAQQVLAQQPPPAANQPPHLESQSFTVAENSGSGTVVGQVVASDPDAGQSLTFALVGGSDAFAIDAATGVITVANAALLDFETTPQFLLQVEVTDNGAVPSSRVAEMSIALQDVVELPPSPVTWVGNDLYVQGTSAADTIYLWSSADNRAYVWLNGTTYGGSVLPAGGQVVVHAGNGNDQIYATDARFSVSIFGEGGHDQITGGSADDLLDGGDGVDRIWGQAGNDVLLGGAGDDFLDGREGDDVIVAGAGNDRLAGSAGRDVLIGGLGSDGLDGGDGEDLLIGGVTSYDDDLPALLAIRGVWQQPNAPVDRMAALAAGLPGGIDLQRGATVRDDGSKDCLNGGGSADALFVFGDDVPWGDTPWDQIL